MMVCCTAEVFDALILVAEEQLNINIRKKPCAQQSKKSRKVNAAINAQ